MEKVADEFARKLFAGGCEFVWGTADIDSLPDARLPEVAFAGRSNAGKSSLINALTNRHALARVSHTPGRTQQINFFDLGDRLMLADLPGYGFARASKALAARWQQLVFAYLRGRPNLHRLLLLIDSRRGATASDRETMALLDDAAVSFAVVLTKIDKLNPQATETAVRAAGEEARRHKAAYPEIFLTSARKGLGIEKLREQLAALALPRPHV